MRKFALAIVYLGVAFGCYWFGASLCEPKLRWGLEFEAINRQDANSYTDQERHTIATKVNLVWDRIENRLKLVAPDSLKTLNGPASDEQIDLFEDRLGMNLPPDLEASLRRHNGTSAQFGAFVMQSVQGIIGEHARLSYATVASWEVSFYEAAFDHGAGKWEPGALVVGWNYFGMLVDTEQKDITLILSSHNYSGPHHDSYLASLEYIADKLDSGDFEISKSEDGAALLMLDGLACDHY